MKRIQPKERLQRLEPTDKWFLSCGDGIIWAPPFPFALHRPGFWDEALVYYHPFAPLFSVAVVRPNGSDLQMEQAGRCWRPDRLTVHWRAGGLVTLKEERVAYPGGRFASLSRCTSEPGWNSAPLQGAHLVCYTAQPGDTVGDFVRSADGSGVEWCRRLEDRHGERLDVNAQLSVDGNLDDLEVRCAAVRSEGSASLPRWEHTPFWEAWRQQDRPGLNDQIRLDGVTSHGLVYAALDIPLTFSRSTSIAFSITLKPEIPPEACPLEACSTSQRSRASVARVL